MKILWQSLSAHETQSILHEMEKICKLAEKLETDQKPFLEYLDKSSCLREFLGFSQETMDNFYRAAYLLHESKHLKEAADAFCLLCTIDPFVHVFWMGYGHSEHLLGNYNSALYAYAMAALTDDSNPLPHCLAAECYIDQSDFKEAKHSLDLAITRAEGSQKHAAIKKTAQEKKQKISHR